MKQFQLINLENVSEHELTKYREAARAIVFDENKLIALLHATKNFYYKLPGGGVEKGEDVKTALERECKEEIGCEVEVLGELGSIVEYRKKYGLKQISFCFIAKLVGEKQAPALTQDEIDEGFETVWLPYDEALKKVKESTPTIYEGPYMVTRDTVLLEAAAKPLNRLWGSK
jgi:8-oxo-dGTP diphosphatase